MDILVCVKETYDLEQVRIDSGTRQPVLDGVPLEVEDLSKNALEAAIRLKEKHGGKITAIALAPGETIKKTIKEALAMGADEAVMLNDPAFADSDSAGKAKILSSAVKKLGKFDILLLGEASGDNYSGQLGSRLAESMNLPFVTYVRELEFTGSCFRALRDLEDCRLRVEAPAPCIMTVTSEINEPRIPQLSAILKAGKKPMKEWKASDIGLQAGSVGSGARMVKIVSSIAPKVERKEIKYEGDIDEATEKLVGELLKEGALKK
jgi:electron transfer flavoprotein beta subunit